MKKCKLLFGMSILSLFLTGCELPAFLNNDFFSFLKKQDNNENEEKEGKEEEEKKEESSEEEPSGEEEIIGIKTGTKLTFDEFIEAMNNRPTIPYTNMELTLRVPNRDPEVVTDSAENNWQIANSYALIGTADDLTELKEIANEELSSITKTYFGYQVDIVFRSDLPDISTKESHSFIDDSFCTISSTQTSIDDEVYNLEVKWWYNVSGRRFKFKEYDLNNSEEAIALLDTVYPKSTLRFDESHIYFNSGVSPLIAAGDYTQNKNIVSYTLNQGSEDGGEMHEISESNSESHLLGKTIEMKVEGLSGATFVVFQLAE